MNRNAKWVLAAALATSGLALNVNRTWAEEAQGDVKIKVDVDAAAPDAPNAADGPSMTRFPEGIKVRSAEETNDDATDGVRDALESITSAAIKGGFDDFVERLVDADRNRIGNFAEGDFPELKAKVGEIKALWKDKYGQDEFDVDDDKAFSTVQFLRGEIEDPKAVAGNWPVPAAGGSEAVPASATEQKAESPDAKSEANLNSDIEKGREVAIATFPASHGAPAVHASMIKQLVGGWRIDAPDTFDGQQLHDNLLKHLTMVAAMKDQWPADANEASAMITHHVLMAVYGLEGQPHGQSDAVETK